MTLSRRRLLSSAALAAATLALPLPALALTASTAEALTRQMVDDITRTINSGKSGAALYREFERIFERYADVPTIARYALGPAARTASRSDLSAFTKAYSGYISRKYGRRFNEFVGGTIEVRGSRVEGSSVVVNTVAKLRGESPFSVDFHLSDRSGRDAFFNVIIEGINMLTTERTEIGALLDRQGGSIPKLTQQLNTIG
jgi:phospholipid transport system substrate-binding protein